MATPTTTNKPGRAPSGNPPEYTRSIRMNDERWRYFKNNLGSVWLREQIDAAIAANIVAKPSDQ
tara:strand:- start:16212 stop:16403 length:192 start_codon:yes stop_codon:yes gene_type:complete